MKVSHCENQSLGGSGAVRVTLSGSHTAFQRILKIRNFKVIP